MPPQSSLSVDTSLPRKAPCYQRSRKHITLEEPNFAPIRLHIREPLFCCRRAPFKELVSTLARLDTIASYKGFEETHKQRVISLIKHARTLIFDLNARSIAAYLEESYLTKLFPCVSSMVTTGVCERIYVKEEQQKNRSYFEFTSDLSQLVFLAQQLLDDLDREDGQNLRFLAHQVASLYSCLSLFSGMKDFRNEIRGRFGDLKEQSTQNELSQELKGWFGGFLTSILDYIATSSSNFAPIFLPLKKAAAFAKKEQARSCLVRHIPPACASLLSTAPPISTALAVRSSSSSRKLPTDAGKISSHSLSFPTPLNGAHIFSNPSTPSMKCFSAAFEPVGVA